MAIPWRNPIFMALAASISAAALVVPEIGSSEFEEIGKKKKRDRKYLRERIEQADEILKRYKEQHGVPGISVGVSVDGEVVWKTGYGYSDVENLIPCTGDSAMRIASISKSLTMTLVAKLMQDGRLDLDAPIQKYLPMYPEKEVGGEKVSITTRHLVSHMAGIRHYHKTAKSSQTTETTTPTGAINQTSNDATAPLGNQSADTLKISADALDRINRWLDHCVPVAFNAKRKALCEKCRAELKEGKPKSELQYTEMYNQKQYDSIADALDMFKDDPLFHKPGTKFLYTTHGWTLVSAVVEAANGRKFDEALKDVFDIFGMHRTYLDENHPLVPNRAKYYQRRKADGFRLENVPSVDNSYKWAGGGVVSSVGDLLTFANGMLHIYHSCHSNRDGCYLSRKTLDEIWKPVEKADVKGSRMRGKYAMGWAIFEDTNIRNDGQFYVCHTGGAIGATSVLLMKPTEKHGIAVAVLANLEDAGDILMLGKMLADLFHVNTC